MTSPQQDKLNERLRKQAAEGNFDLLDPFDYLLMDLLPKEGAMLSGLYPVGEMAGGMKKKFPKEAQGHIPGRLRRMEAQGLALRVQVLGQATKNAWQITSLGQKQLKEWKDNHGN